MNKYDIMDMSYGEDGDLSNKKSAAVNEARRRARSADETNGEGGI